MIYIVDIDNTICITDSSNYYESSPIVHRINKINELYDAGNTIIYWTARGMSSGKDWKNLTQKQLTEWNCKYHELWMNKPSYDIWIDDKADWIFE
jgi:hypothetical protein